MACVCHALHAACPALRIVVTSQAPLKIAAERVVRIEPLGVPEAAAPALQANQFGAIALFVERVQAIDARFALTDANAPAVIELCRALDGLPLAIELAAARAPLLGVPHLLASMRERLQLLSANRNRRGTHAAAHAARGAGVEPRFPAGRLKHGCSGAWA